VQALRAFESVEKDPNRTRGAITEAQDRSSLNNLFADSIFS